MMYFQSVDSGHHPRPQTSPVLPGQHHGAVCDDVPAGSGRLPPPARLRGEGFSRVVFYKAFPSCESNNILVI